MSSIFKTTSRIKETDKISKINDEDSKVLSDVKNDELVLKSN